ncbi:Txe/YoeB family addiction module toxin [Parabacteroides sp. PF5-6]|uniref:Txe/YoeB family addiction module toxin n=1 Tax=Parabacteroides sp. PF5-6 TaxID=1742403 RepID=UPI0024067921|nr:Txe/YoeB family addiction module toxin [Parabacteroides sp. PF5-6]MDF9830872.1 toxin YoeB [Parabacteroides sp. PF5-6]
MIYKVSISPIADKGIKTLKRSEPAAYKKTMKLILELQDHPETGTGHPKPLGKNRVGQWSRKITDKHRLVYQIDNEQITVLVLSSYGHYDDK